MTTPFVDVPRAKELKTLAAVDDVSLNHLLAAACDAVQNYCRRQFATTTYDEFFQGTNTRSLFLNEYPVQLVTSVRYGRQVAIQITNSTQYIQSATVTALPDQLVLAFTNNNVTTTTDLAWATYPTIGQLGAAVNALGGGWQATVSPAFNTWASADLSAYTGTKSARTVMATYAVHYYEMSDYMINDPNSGELFINNGWHGPTQAFRVLYTAGYDVIPEELVQATVELAAATYTASKADPNLQAESLGSYSYTRAATKSIADLSLTARQTLEYYRRPLVPYFAAKGV